ncbi:glutamate 5-kinase [Glaciecola petra]|uniref:Glutamate 5-kinase n=1 Tax=Glaciecola petra TaxID=3075602 RepID=A0ABU2ZR63_9ALTE|nr:glutamate 5-kinase [Aestuariibacter sp. P117]MDT0595107.1 glutamate 5-kinase [Aestuariibacter sp. P117]
MKMAEWQRAVIKVGSALVAPSGEGCSSKYLSAIANFILQCNAQGKEIILVSSGSIAAARTSIKSGHHPSIAEKQAMAALGQMQMMSAWSDLFSPNLACAQLLLSAEDLADRKRFVNIKNTLEQLLLNHALPIVNENDTVAVDEIKVGDNDNLAAHTAIAAQADCLIICTDVNGLYTANPRTKPNATLIKQVDKIDTKVMRLAGGAGSSVGTGGMVTKLEAAKKCTQAGIQTILLNGTDGKAFSSLAAGNNPGTLFAPNLQKSKARQDWLRHTSKVKGKLWVDSGANTALLKTGASLLAAGIVAIEGSFNAGDNIEIHCQHAVQEGSQSTLVGKGLVAYSSSELKRIMGCNSQDIEQILGYNAGEAAVHRDNLVLHQSMHD